MYQLTKINTSNSEGIPLNNSNHMKQHNNPQPSLDNKNQEYILSDYRYINLIIYLVTALANSLPAQTFSSMNSLVQDRFQISAVYVTLNALIFPIMHPIAAFPSGWIIDKFGMKIGCIIGGVSVIAGTWLRSLLSVGNPWVCLLGSFFAAFGNVFILNSAALMAVNWFQSELVSMITMISVLINFLSAAIGASVAGWFLNMNSERFQIITFLRWEAILITIPFLLFFLFFKQRPQTPPSHAATQNSLNSNQDYKKTLKVLINNKQYIKIGLTASFSFGTVISFFSILNQCLTTLGYADPGNITSTTISSMMVSSIISIIITSLYVKKTKKYKLVISICILGGISGLSLLCTLYFTVTQNIFAIILVGIFAGLFIFPLNSLLIAYGSDVAFPVGQGSITGYLFAFSQTFGFIIGICFIAWIDRDNVWKIYITMGLHILFFIFALYFNLSTKQILSRTKFQQEKLLSTSQKYSQQQ